ncbi:MAG: phosphoribosyltransferase [Prevotellamassilia sp.]|nr:phosphoribosyltransferase [Prevotellamassilia sp.]
MKSLFTLIGFWVGNFIALMICSDDTPPIIGIIISIGGAFGGRYIASQIEEEKEKEKENERKQKEEYERRRWQEERERERKAQRRSKAQILAKKYPEATKHYFMQHWSISKSYVSDYDITDDKVDTLLSHEYEYERDEQKYNSIYRLKIEVEKEAKRRAEREAAERKRREEELAWKRKEEEKRNLPTSLPACVASWSSHSKSCLKHKYFFDYYPYGAYQFRASASMWDTWRTVWHFKNDPDKKVTSYEHRSALQTVTNLVENALRSAFGSKTEYLTLVCLTASTQRKTELRFKDFAEQVCKDLNMNNAYPHIQVIERGNAKHDGGDSSRKVSYDRYFFSGKYVVLFDDVRTTGHSLEQERRTMEELGAKVICAVTIAQTTY